MLIILITFNHQTANSVPVVAFYDNFEYDNILFNEYSLSENRQDVKKFVNTSENAVYSGSKGLFLEGNFPQAGSEVVRNLVLPFHTAKILSFYVFMLSSFRWKFRVNVIDQNGQEVYLSYGKAGAHWIDSSNYNVGIYFNYLNWKRIYRNIEHDLKEAIGHQDSPIAKFKPILVQSYSLIADIGYNGGCFDDIIFSNELLPFTIQANSPICSNNTQQNPRIEDISPPPYYKNTTEGLIDSEYYPYIFGGIVLVIYLFYYLRKRQLYRSNRNKQPKMYPEIKD
jgi:hypothetical protein